MRVLFCNPPTVDATAVVREGRCEHRAASFQYLMAPISLPYCAAVVRAAGHEVSLVDCVADGMDVPALVASVARLSPDLIVLAVTTVTFPGDAEVVQALKDACDAHVTAIGIHVTALPEASLAASRLDSVVRGEPEFTVRALSDAIAGGGALSEVQGLSYRDGDSVVHNPDRAFIEDLDALPFPARDLLHNDRYLAPLSDLTQTPLIPARGCAHGCTYCTAHCYYGRRPRTRSAASVVDEMQECFDTYGIDEILMWSDTFTADRRFVTELCREIARRGMSPRWICNSRVDTVDLELLQMMRDAGCWAIAYGVESGSQELLDRARKGTTLAQARDALRWTREAGLASVAHVIVGLPGETAETARQTADFVREIDPDYVQVYCAVPFPGSDLYETALEEGWLITDDWGRFEQANAIVSTPTMSAAQLAATRTRLFRAFYLRPSYVARQLRGVGSLRHLRRLARGAVGFARDWASRDPNAPKR